MRILSQQLWQTQKWRKKIKDIKERYLWLYLLSCPNSKTCGIFYIPTETIANETKLSEEDVIKYLNHFKELSMVDYNEETEEILIYNFPKYNIIRLGKPMEDCLRSELSLVRDTNLIRKMISYLEKYIEYRVNDKKINMLTNILNIYNKSISISITTESLDDSCHDTKEEDVDWDELMKLMEDDD